MRKPVFGFPTTSNTNWAIQPQKTARGLKFCNLKEEGLYNEICPKSLWTAFEM